MTPVTLLRSIAPSNAEAMELPAEARLIDQMRVSMESQFPTGCKVCRQQYESLRQYLQTTMTVGPAMSYDADMGDWQPLKPMGIFMLANCLCGNTMALSSSQMPLPQLWLLLAWVRRQMAIRKQTSEEILNNLRAKITRQVLA